MKKEILILWSDCIELNCLDSIVRGGFNIRNMILASHLQEYVNEKQPALDCEINTKLLMQHNIWIF